MSSTTSCPTTPCSSYTSSSDSEMEMPLFEPFTPKSRSDDLTRAPLRKTEKRLSMRNVDSLSRAAKIQKISSTEDVSYSSELLRTPQGADRQCASTNAPRKLRRPPTEEPSVSTSAFEELLGLPSRFDNSSPDTPHRNVLPRTLAKPARRYSN